MQLNVIISSVLQTCGILLSEVGGFLVALLCDFLKLMALCDFLQCALVQLDKHVHIFRWPSFGPEKAQRALKMV